MKTIIAPSLLACDFLNIEAELKSFSKSDNVWIHLDIMDGHFVPNLTFGIPIIEKISKVAQYPLDAHLMVTNPKFHIEQMKAFGIHNLTFHYEAVSNHIELIELAKQYYPSVGISLKPHTELTVLDKDLLEKIDLLLIMSVEPGFGGQSFIETSYKKIEQAIQIKKDNNYHFQIQIDGGVSDQNAKKLVGCGATNLVAGSYIFNNKPRSYIDKIESLRS